MAVSCRSETALSLIIESEFCSRTINYGRCYLLPSIGKIETLDLCGWDARDGVVVSTRANTYTVYKNLNPLQSWKMVCVRQIAQKVKARLVESDDDTDILDILVERWEENGLVLLFVVSFPKLLESNGKLLKMARFTREICVGIRMHNKCVFPRKVLYDRCA